VASASGLRLNRSDPVGDDRAAEGAVKSAKRVLEIFEFFAERKRPASVGDVVEALGYPQSSTSALLKSLVQLRYLCPSSEFLRRAGVARDKRLRLIFATSWATMNQKLPIPIPLNPSRNYRR